MKLKILPTIFLLISLNPIDFSLAKEVEKKSLSIEASNIIEHTQPQTLDDHRALANNGDLDAQMYLAKKFCQADALDDEALEGTKWANALIERKCAVGYMCLAKLYDHSGQIYDKNYHDKIIGNYEKASELGLPDAYLRLGATYSGGSYLERDDKKAFYLFKKASDLESLDLDDLNDFYSRILAESYYDGRGVERDLEKAIAHFEYKANDKQIQKAKMHKHSIGYVYGNEKYMLALIELGNMYRDGKGVQKDEKKAFDLYKKAIIAGSSDRDCHQEEPLHLHKEYLNTLSQVAKYYEEGILTPTDKTKAQKYREIKTIFKEQQKSPPYPRLSDSDFFIFLHGKEK